MYKVAQQGIKEVVLTGVNIGDYGIIGNRRQANFLTLIQALDQVTGIHRFRISSIEPNLLNNAIIDFVTQSKRFVPHFHIPLQSGSDKILKLMRRRYQQALYVDRITTIRQNMPQCCIGVDIIAGFPGETEKDFLTTYHFLNELPIAYLHVFPYSERTGTHATNLAEIVPYKERIRRAKMLRILSEKKMRRFYEDNLGRIATVLFEQGNTQGYIEGFTENYIRVSVPYDNSLPNSLRRVSLQRINTAGLVVCNTTANTHLRKITLA